MTATTICETIRSRFPEFVIGTHAYRGQETVVLKREGVVPVARFLRDDAAMAFDYLLDLTGVDYMKFGQAQASRPTRATPSPLPYYMEPKPTTERWERLPGAPEAAQAGRVCSEEYRFDVVYHFYSTRHNHRVRVKVPLASADPVLDSLTGLWHGANWFEREVWDLFGIRFNGHPHLKRILMYEGFHGHPLRKDYPSYKRQPLIGPLN